MANPMTKEEKQWVVVTIMFVAVILVAFYFLYFKKSVSEYSKIAKTRTELKEEVKSMKDVLEGGSLQNQIADLEVKIARFEERLPSEKDVPKLMTFLREAADSAGVSYKSIATMPQVPETYYIEIPYNVELIGRYHNIGRFLNQVENQTRIMKVDSMDLTAASGEEIGHSAKFRLVTYMYNPVGVVSEDTTSADTKDKKKKKKEK